MKAKFIAGAALIASLTVAGSRVPAEAQSVQAWTVSAGLCSDWRGTWAMQHAGPGHWIGTSVLRVVGNQCTRRPIGTQITADVDFRTFGNHTWTATTTHTDNATDCRYSGRVNANNAAAGTYSCAGQTNARSNILITSPAAFYKMGG